MKARILLCVVMVGFAAMVVSHSLGAGEKQKEQKKEGAAEMAPPKPGAPHKLLAKLAGQWAGSIRMWMGPGEPKESKATVSRTMIMGGLYLKEDVVGDFMGMKFNGLGILGYDVNKKKFVTAWIDNFGTGIMVTQGDYDWVAETLTYVGEEDNPMLGGKTKTRDVLKFTSDDQHIFEMHRTPLVAGKEIKIMEITFTRMKDVKKAGVIVKKEETKKETKKEEKKKP